MTTFYLYWWWGEQLFQFLEKNIDPNLCKNILILYHAKDADRWKNSFVEDCELFSYSLFKNSNCIMWSENLDELAIQIYNSDMILIKWWSSLVIKERLEPLKSKFKKLLLGKVVVAISAWAYLLSEKFYSNGRDLIDNGFSILPWLFVICHYSLDIEHKIDSIKKTWDLEIIRLEEYHGQKISQ